MTVETSHVPSQEPKPRASSGLLLTHCWYWDEAGEVGRQDRSAVSQGRRLRMSADSKDGESCLPGAVPGSRKFVLGAFPVNPPGSLLLWV